MIGALESLHPFQVFVLLPAAVGLSSYLLFGSFFFVCDYYLARQGTVGQHKIQWKKFKEGRPFQWGKYRRMTRNSLVNLFLVSLPTFVAFYPLWKWRDIDLALPPFEVIFLQLLVTFLVLEVLFYYSHRLFHVPYFYRHIHYVHHEANPPFGLGNFHCHPVEQLCANTLPVMLGPLLAGLHPLLYCGWLFVAIANSVATHSGYRWRVIGAHFHDLHHKKHTVNFGTMNILDMVHKTFANKVS